MGAGRENDNCVGLKIAKTLALHLAPLCTGCKIGPIVLKCLEKGQITKKLTNNYAESISVYAGEFSLST